MQFLVKTHHRMITKPFGRLFFALILFLFVLPVKAETVLQVGVRVVPPFVIKNETGELAGISIVLWKAIADDLNLAYQFHEVSLQELVEGVESQRFDLAVAALTVTAERERVMDFTHPFLSSGLGIAVPTSQSSSIFEILRALFSWQFLNAMLALLTVLGLIGLLIWWLERRANPQQFGGKTVQGIGAGLWWSAVTMTTVGFGDKAPITFWGRVLAMIWMFTSVITISGFTATIASVFTLQQMQGNIRGPQDLPGKKVGVISGSTGEKYALSHRLQMIRYDKPERALTALTEQQVDAVIYDLSVLRFLIAEQKSKQLSVLPGTFDRQDYAFALVNRSSLRESVNESLLKYLKSKAWKNNLARYLGDEQDI